jgi:PE family
MLSYHFVTVSQWLTGGQEGSMSFVSASPEYVAAAATDLAAIGSTISSANALALGPTSGVLPPGADEVSATIAALFGVHSQAYQALSAQAAAFHTQFVQLMNGGAAQYAVTEAANVTPLQTAAAPASMAAQVPAVAAGAVSGSASGAPAAPLASAVSAVSSAAPAPAAAPIGATPTAATLTSASGQVAPMRVATPGYAPAAAAPAAPAPVSTFASAAPAAAPEVSPATAMPMSAGTPLAAATPHAATTAAQTGSSAREAPPIVPKVE